MALDGATVAAGTAAAPFSASSVVAAAPTPKGSVVPVSAARPKGLLVSVVVVPTPKGSEAVAVSAAKGSPWVASPVKALFRIGAGASTCGLSSMPVKGL